MRRLSLSEYHVLSVLEEPKKEPLENLKIELFEGDNYIYLMDMQDNKFCAEYIVKNDFTDIYVTRNEMNSSIEQTATQIELSVNQKLTGYSTTEEMSSAITQSAESITSTVSKNYTTKTETASLKSEIKQTTDSISTEVSKKVGDDEVISKINQSAEAVGINADKIELSANDILNLLSGNTINLTSKNIVISSTNFSVDKNGNVIMNNGTFNGGQVDLFPKTGINAFRYFNSASKDTSNMVYINGNVIGINRGNYEITLSAFSGSNEIKITDEGGKTYIYGSGIETPKLTQTSLEIIKKNIEKLDKNALEIIKNSDIYEYNLKTDQDTDKKLIGFIIGENYRTPPEVISKDGNAIELYSAIGVLWKAIQEQEKEIEELKKEIKEIKKMIGGTQ